MRIPPDTLDEVRSAGALSAVLTLGGMEWCDINFKFNRVTLPSVHTETTQKRQENTFAGVYLQRENACY